MPSRSSRPINLCGLTVGVSKCLTDLAMLLDQPAPSKMLRAGLPPVPDDLDQDGNLRPGSTLRPKSLR